MKKPNRSRFSRKNPITSATPLTFFIESMDALGQGVDKSNELITFIPKTLPEEAGTARVVKKRKGVQFAQLINLETTAENRIQPECIHFNECPGCDYLHTDYQSELIYKKAALEHALYGLPTDNINIETVAAEQRLHYRNRVQLHYRGQSLGLLDADNNKIIEIPRCQLAEPVLQEAIDDLYNNREWSKVLKNTGHCEVADIDGKAEVFWNKPYAFGGFTQVNTQMNLQLRERVKKAVLATKPQSIIDLFSGSGNLSDDIVSGTHIRRAMVDVSECSHPDFIALDLFADDALKHFQALNPLRKLDTLLIDPPRKGFPALAQWIKALKPQYLVYVSCNAATMARDIKNIEKFARIEQIQLLDMFPSSKHFETLLVLKL